LKERARGRGPKFWRKRVPQPRKNPERLRDAIKTRSGNGRLRKGGQKESADLELGLAPENYQVDKPQGPRREKTESWGIEKGVVTLLQARANCIKVLLSRKLPYRRRRILLSGGTLRGELLRKGGGGGK